MKVQFFAALALLGVSSPSPAQAPSAERPWTLLVYGAADNNADGPILHFMDRVRKAIDDDPGIELVFFVDRHERYSDDARLLGEDFEGARIYRLRRDSAERLAGGEEFPEITLEEDVELDSADPENVRRFIAFGKKHFPAQKYGLLIYSHADGRTMCPDDESAREMSIPEFSALISEREAVDFLALELCNMGGIEIAYQLRPGTGRFFADVLVAIPNAGPPLDWDRAFARIRSSGHEGEAPEPYLDPATMTAADFGTLVIQEGRLGRKEAAMRDPRDAEAVQYESAACYDLREAGKVKEAIDALAAELARTDAREAFEELRGPGAAGCALNYARDQIEEVPYVDLYDLCARAAQCERLSADARRAAETACAAVDSFVIASFGMQGLPGFEPGKNGVFIVFPSLSGSGAWKSFAWYTPRRGDGEKEPYGRWAFLKDGASEGNGVVENWYELLDSWFDDSAEGSGGLNGYRW